MAYSITNMGKPVSASAGYDSAGKGIDHPLVNLGDLINHPEVLGTLIDVANEEYTLFDHINLTSSPTVTEDPIYNHHENRDIYKRITLDNTDPTKGLSIGDYLLESDGSLSIVKDNGSGGMDIAPVESGGTAAGGTEDVTVIGSAFPEGSGGPGFRQYGVDVLWNQVQIFKSAMRVTDIERVNRIWFKVGGQARYYYKTQLDTIFRHRHDISLSFLAGVRSEDVFRDGPSATAGGNHDGVVQTTGGLNWWITGGAGTGTGGAVQSGGVTEANIDALAAKMIANKAPLEYTVFNSFAAEKGWTKVLSGWGDGAAMTASTNIGRAQSRYKTDQKVLDIGFKTVRVHGFTFHLRRLPMLDHPGIFGNDASGSGAIAGYGDSAFLIPAGNANVFGGGSQPYLGCRYMPVNGSFIDEYVGGKLAPTNKTREAALIVEYQTIAGLQVVAAKHFAKITG